MNHKVNINIEFILTSGDDLSSFDKISEYMREGFTGLSSDDTKEFKFTMNIEEIKQHENN